MLKIQIIENDATGFIWLDVNGVDDFAEIDYDQSLESFIADLINSQSGLRGSFGRTTTSADLIASLAAKGGHYEVIEGQGMLDQPSAIDLEKIY